MYRHKFDVKWEHILCVVHFLLKCFIGWMCNDWDI